MPRETQPPEDEHPSLDGPKLPDELAEFLRGYEMAAVFESTNFGTGLVVKLPRREIEGLRGIIPIHLRHELHRRPTAPVIRTVVRLYDRPNSPLALETMTNIADENQRTEFAALEAQKTIYMHFYDEQLRHPLSKCIGYDGQSVPRLVALAQEHLDGIPQSLFDFDRAKAEVMAATEL